VKAALRHAAFAALKTLGSLGVVLAGLALWLVFGWRRARPPPVSGAPRPIRPENERRRRHAGRPGPRGVARPRALPYPLRYSARPEEP